MLASLREQNRIIANSNLELEKALSFLAQSHNELKSSERYFQDMVDKSDNAILVHDATGKILDVNRNACELVGYSRGKLINRRILSLIPNDEHQKFAGIIQVILAKGTYSFESKFKRGDSTNINIEVSTRVIDKEEGILKSIITDITAITRTRERLLHQKVLASLGEMTAGIAHEVNNPLGSILLYSELLLKDDNLLQNKKDLRVIHSEAKRAARILTDLLIYSHGVETKMSRLSLHKIVGNVVKMRRYEANVKNIRILTNLCDRPLYVTGSPSQLTQAFMNIMLNAEDELSGRDNAQIIITTRVENKWAVVAIADNGRGIAEEHLNQLFYPFFTTKAAGEGSGLRLSTCYGIITNHGGLIHAENNETGGATFVIELPILEPQHDTKQSPKENLTQ